MHKRGMSSYFVEKFLPHSVEKSRTAILQCFTDSSIEKFFALEG